MGLLDDLKARLNMKQTFAERRAPDSIFSYPVYKRPVFPGGLRRIRSLALASPELRTIIMALKRSIFRRGLQIEPHFTSKCTKEDCEKEFDYETDVCDSCNSPTRGPSEKERKVLQRWLDNANLNGQPLEEVLNECEFDVDVFDDLWLQLQYTYSFNPDGSILTKELGEIVRADPAYARFIDDGKGNLGMDSSGNEVRTCLYHRELKTSDKKCPECGKLTFPAYYYLEVGQKQTHFVEGEMIHASKYHPTRTYGHSPVLTLWIKTRTLIVQEAYMHDLYEGGRPPKAILHFNTDNEATVAKWMSEAKERQKQNPNDIAPLAFHTEKGGGSPVTFIPLMQPPSETQYLETRNEARRMMGALYGVMPMMSGDIEKSGGLNNESRQITVMSWAIEAGQKLWNHRILPKISDALGIEDWQIEITPADEVDEIEEVNVMLAKVQHAQGMAALNFEVDMDEAGEFIFTPPSEQEEQRGELATNLLSKFRIEGMRQAAPNPERVKVFMEALFSRKFDGMSARQSDNIKTLILRSLMVNESPQKIAEAITKRYPGIPKDQAEAIARTETHEMRMAATMENYEEMDVPVKWIGPADSRTSQICQNIKTRTAKGVSTSELKKIIQEEAKKEGTDAREMTPHPNCRHRAVRAF